MTKFLNILAKKLKRNRPKKETVLALFLSVLIVGCIHFFGTRFIGALWALVGLLFLFIVSVFTLRTSFVVMKSLFFTAAEISLLIYLAQTYCTSPGRSSASDNALASLLTFGIIYIIYQFYRCLRDSLKSDYGLVKAEVWSKEKVLSITLYLSLTILFIWQIFLVLKPILLGLCVKPPF